MARYSYQHITAGDKQITICHSRYAGKRIIGKAVCQPGDEYSPEIGETIARAKLDKKVQVKRIKRHKQNIAWLYQNLDYIKSELERELTRLGRDERMFEECEEILNNHK